MIENMSGTAALHWWTKLGKGKFDKYWNLSNKRSQYLVKQLKQYEFNSIYEVGFLSGRNLHYIQKEFPDIKIGGTDVNERAISYANERLKNAFLENDSIENMSQEKWDIIFTCAVLIHVPNIDNAIKNCISKANKYIIHLEANADDKIMYGPKCINPEILSNRFEWFPNIYKRYKEMGLDVSCEEIPKGIWTQDCSHFIIVKL